MACGIEIPLFSARAVDISFMSNIAGESDIPRFQLGRMRFLFPNTAGKGGFSRYQKGQLGPALIREIDIGPPAPDLRPFAGSSP